MLRSSAMRSRLSAKTWSCCSRAESFTRTSGAGLLPRLRKQRALQLAQTPLGCADHVLHGRITHAHLLEHFLGRNAAAHGPNPPRLAELAFDPCEEVLQRRFVGGCAPEPLRGAREPFWRDNERDHDLHAIRALVTRIPQLPFVGLRHRGSL